MGAAASTNLLYKDALLWFRQYFDANQYVADFNAMDKDHDGGISFSELHRWINERAAKEGNPWTMLLSHPEIIEIAHDQAVKAIEHSDVKYIIHKKVVDIATFRSLLIQLFAISIIWVHFKKADDHATNDAFDEKLNFHEFSRAVKTFSAAYGQEEVSDAKLFEDFCALDKDSSGGITFAEVCNFCCRFADPKTAEKFLTAEYGVKDLLNASTGASEDREHVLGKQHLPDTEVHAEKAVPGRILKELADRPSLHELEESHLQAKHLQTADSTNSAFQTVAEEMEKNKNIAQFVELKLQTEALLEGEGVVLSAAALQQQQHPSAEQARSSSVADKSPRPPPSPRPEPSAAQ